MVDRLAESGALQYATESGVSGEPRLGAAGYIQGVVADAGTLTAAPISRLSARGRILGALWDYQQLTPDVESFILPAKKIRLSADQIAVGKSCYVSSVTCVSNSGTTSVVLRDNPVSASGETVISTGTMTASQVITYTDNDNKGRLFLMGCYFDVTGTGTYDIEVYDAL